MRTTILAKLVLSIILLAGIGLAIIYRDFISFENINNWIDNSGFFAPIIFMGLYITGTVFFLPGSLLTLVGGALFGPVMGTFLNLTAATVGAMISFLIARYLASDWVAKKSAGRLKQLMNGIENEGWRFVAFTRLVPLFPFNLLNYALGLTRISFSQYSITTYICMLPGALAYTYLGYIGKEAATGGEDLVQKIMLAIAFLAIAMFIPRVISNMRKVDMIDIESLKKELDSNKDILLLDVRSLEDYTGEQGHIKQSTLLPLETLKQRLDEIDSYRDKPVVIICRTDKRSSKAAKILLSLGFENVKVAKMGMTDWIKHQYPTCN